MPLKMASAVKARPTSPGLRPSARDRYPGRVANLEAYVRPDWWRMVFDELYLKTDGDLVENERNTRAEVDAVVAAAGLRPSDRVLDLCCGQGRHSLELARRGFRGVIGVDQSPYLIGLARRRARAARLEVGFVEGDARCTQVAEASFDCVLILGNSFGYFERAEEDALLLRPGAAGAARERSAGARPSPWGLVAHSFRAAFLGMDRRSAAGLSRAIARR
jgi:D-alanine-D-alanine ligase